MSALSFAHAPRVMSSVLRSRQKFQVLKPVVVLVAVAVVLHDLCRLKPSAKMLLHDDPVLIPPFAGDASGSYIRIGAHDANLQPHVGHGDAPRSS